MLFIVKSNFFFFLKKLFTQKNIFLFKYLFVLNLPSLYFFFKKKNFFFFEIFFKKYFLFKQQKNIFLEIKKINILFVKNVSFYWFLKLLKKTTSKNKNKIIQNEEFLKLLFSSFLLKDCSIVLNWLKFSLESIGLKGHKPLLNYLFNILNLTGQYLLSNFSCIGLKLVLNGKLGIGGSIKTKTIIFKKGRNSLNNKNLKLDYKKIQIKTKSGTLGLKYFLFF